ncbi:MAG: MFS transporter [Candidatus Limnocylindrales bacterium]
MNAPRAAAALRHRNFRLFWSGQLVSLVGTWMQTVAQGWLVLTLTNDPVALGIAAACQFTPILLFGLFGGILADALPKRQTLIATQSTSLLLALALGILVATGTVQVWHVYLLAIGLGLVNAVDMPVRQAFAVEMVGREDIANAVALNSAVFNGARIVGPALAGILIGIVGIAACFFLNAISYVAVIAAYLLMRETELRPAARIAMAHTIGGVIDQLGEGLSYVRRTPIPRLALTTLGIVSLVGMNFSVLMPVFAQNVLGGDATTFGFLLAASGVGSISAAIHIANGLRPTLRLVVGAATSFGAALLALSFAHQVIVALPLMLILGWSVIAMAATTNTLIQVLVPDELRGRVLSIYTTVFAGSTPIGGLLVGSIAGLFGVSAALAFGGVVSLGTAGIAALRVRAMPDGTGDARSFVRGLR